ncbi:MAG: hypothetical protein PHX62_08570, partial [Bacilli bacterium]|nr:hypothetical protein [Bacilli bacterium]
LTDYQKELSLYRSDEKNYKELLQKNKTDQERIDFLKFQANELEKINPSLEEEDELKNRSHYLNNFEVISQNLQEILSLYQDNNILEKVYDSLALLERMESFKPSFREYKKQIEDGYYTILDVISEISQELQKLDFDPNELDSINERLGVYSDLKRKYRLSTEEIIKKQQEIKNELNNIENYDFLLGELEKTAKKSYNKTLEIAKNISDIRKNNARNLEKQILENLADLQLKNVEFQILFKETENIFRKDGIDEVDFLVTFNIGEPMRPLSKIASGGELSRFMLALKTLVSEKLNLQTIIFDEIDNGVSGAIAYSIASKIKKISERSQVLCVTHIPQVAAFSDNHYQIEKKVDEEMRTKTHVKELAYEDRVIEIAKMISNGQVTSASRALAIELLKK